MTLSLKLCDDKSFWDNFVADSPQGTVFASTPFLDSIEEEYDLLLVVDAVENPLLGAVVIMQDGKPIIAPYPDAMYLGLLFTKTLYSKPIESRINRCLELSIFLLNEMEKLYDRISFFHHHSIDDLRSFKWFHYHEPKLGQFQIELSYTGITDLSPYNSFDEYLSTIRKVRRREYRRALNKGLIVTGSNNIDILNELHKKTFERQGIKRSKKEECLIYSISEAAIKHNFGQLLICQDCNEMPISATLFVYDKYTGYYIFAGNDPAYRKFYSGTLLMLENIKFCLDMGLKWVDFGGINSPNRGDFKISFNAKPVPYIITTWDKTNY